LKKLNNKKKDLSQSKKNEYINLGNQQLSQQIILQSNKKYSSIDVAKFLKKKIKQK
jgi:hypothetical protein